MRCIQADYTRDGQGFSQILGKMGQIKELKQPSWAYLKALNDLSHSLCGKSGLNVLKKKKRTFCFITCQKPHLL